MDNQKPRPGGGPPPPIMPPIPPIPPSAYLALAITFIILS